jgi:hypothetical protein
VLDVLAETLLMGVVAARLVFVMRSQGRAPTTRQADQLAAGASSIATKGGDVVGRMVEAMVSINDSSKQIAEIIGVIDGIAFQTNIRALNAAAADSMWQQAQALTQAVSAFKVPHVPRPPETGRAILSETMPIAQVDSQAA